MKKATPPNADGVAFNWYRDLFWVGIDRRLVLIGLVNKEAIDEREEKHDEDIQQHRQRTII